MYLPSPPKQTTSQTLNSITKPLAQPSKSGPRLMKLNIWCPTTFLICILHLPLKGGPLLWCVITTLGLCSRWWSAGWSQRHLHPDPHNLCMHYLTWQRTIRIDYEIRVVCQPTLGRFHCIIMGGAVITRVLKSGNRGQEENQREAWRWRSGRCITVGCEVEEGPKNQTSRCPLEAGKGKEIDLPLEPLEMQPCYHLDFSPLRSMLEFCAIGLSDNTFGLF